MNRQSTVMLLAVGLVCAAVEVPHAILHLATGVAGSEFGLEIYDRLGDLFEMLTILYSSINFVMYCSMNQRFRDVVSATFCGSHRNLTITPNRHTRDTETMS